MKHLHNLGSGAADAVAVSNGHVIRLIVMCIIFYIFAFGYTKDPSSYVTSTSDDLIEYYPWFDDNSGAVTGTDIGQRFHLLFLYSFYVSAFHLVCLLVMSFLSLTIMVNLVLFRLLQITSTTLGLLWILGFIWRFSSSGRAASGDFADGWDQGGKGYLFFQGSFIFICFFLLIFILIMRML